MKKYGKLFAGNAVFAAVEVFLFSPGLLGLSPFSPNPLKAAAAIAAGVMSVPLFIWLNRILLAEKKAELLKADEEHVWEKSLALMEHYRSSKVLGGIAQSAIAQMERMDKVQETFETLVIRRFGAGSLSYEKFMKVIVSACECFSNGMIRMANKMAIFDEAEYKKLASMEYKLDDIPDEIQEEKKLFYDKTLENLRFILEKNEKILLETDHLMMEMSEMGCSEQDIDAVAEQIHTLIGQLEYYT